MSLLCKCCELHTFEILLAKVEHDNTYISTVVLIYDSRYNLQIMAIVH